MAQSPLEVLVVDRRVLGLFDEAADLRERHEATVGRRQAEAQRARKLAVPAEVKYRRDGSSARRARAS